VSEGLCHSSVRNVAGTRVAERIDEMAAGEVGDNLGAVAAKVKITLRKLHEGYSAGLHASIKPFHAALGKPELEGAVISDANGELVDLSVLQRQSAYIYV
jgi:hypothetical protein